MRKDGDVEPESLSTYFCFGGRNVLVHDQLREHDSHHVLEFLRMSFQYHDYV